MSTHQKSTTRRRALTTFSAAGIAAVAPATVARSHPDDAEIKRLYAEYLRLRQLYGDVTDSADRAREAASAAFPSRPPELIYNKRLITEEEINAWYGEREYIAACKEQLMTERNSKLNALRRYRDACHNIECAHGVDDLDSRGVETWDEYDFVRDMIRRTPAMTATGVLIKLLVADELEGFLEQAASENTAVAPQMIAAAVADLRRLANLTVT